MTPEELRVYNAQKKRESRARETPEHRDARLKKAREHQRETYIRSPEGKGRPPIGAERMVQVTISVPRSVVEAWREHERGVSYAAREALGLTEAKEADE